MIWFDTFSIAHGSQKCVRNILTVKSGCLVFFGLYCILCFSPVSFLLLISAIRAHVPLLRDTMSHLDFYGRLKAV